MADCKLYGPVYEFSAYRFENEMGRIREMVRSPYKKLEQIYNRSMENMLFSKNCTYNRNNYFKIAANDQDSYFLLNDGQVARVEAVCEDGSLNVRFIDKMDEELFLQPKPSSALGIHICKLSCTVDKIPRSSIVSKLYRMWYSDREEDDDDDVDIVDDSEENIKQDMNFSVQFVLVPLLHESL